MIGCTSTTCFLSWIFPRVMREMSSRSSMSRERFFTCPSMICVAHSSCSWSVVLLQDLHGVADGGERDS